MDSLEIVTRINILDSHCDELNELIQALEFHPVERAQILVQVARATRQIYFLELQLQR